MANLTANLFIKINRIGYLLGLPNVSVYGVDFSEKIKKFCWFYKYVTLALLCAFIFGEWGALFTQKNLSVKQGSDLFIFTFAHPLLFLWIVVTEYQKDRIKNFLYQLTIVLKELYNDEEVEREMLRNTVKSCTGFSAIFMAALVSYGYNGVMQVIRGEGTFTTVIMVWPDVHHASCLADLFRLFCYLMWWVFMTRVLTVYVTIISTLVCLSHQFKNLQSYFYSLDEIFSENLGQEQKEKKYEGAFKHGIRMHSLTLWCTKECQSAYTLLFSVQVFTAVVVLALLMDQLSSERTLENILSILSSAFFILMSTGFVMWNAGDITVEAAALAPAMYSSGWHNCRGSASRVRRLVVFSMMQSQRPVVLRALGIIDLSYSSYVSIVKSSYSVFSVLV